MKYFNNIAILTTKNPEAFLNFSFDADNYWILPDCSVDPGFLYVNGIDITEHEVSLGYCLLLDATNNYASFHVYSPINYNFDVSLNFTFYDSDDLTSDVSSHTIQILNRPYIISENTLNPYNNDDYVIDDQASYLVLRTNPKFTGNIVLNVDASDNMYFDTFKVSDILSNKLYRRQQVSANSVLSSDVRNVYSSMPLGELYRVEAENTLNISTPKTELEKQFYTTYNYGARLLKDELYKEDNALLAPLWINSKLPDYFTVLRLDGVYNPESYDEDDETDLAFKYLEESDIIKTWSLKPDAPLGKYLKTHLNDLIKLQSPLFLSLTDPGQNESDPNTWYGIAVDKGVLTGRSETTYQFDINATNFTRMNAFLSNGFERNTLLCPNLLNLQYIFDDNDVSLYTMHRYFGLYLTENILYRVAYYSDTEYGTVNILSLDGKDSSTFFNSAIFDSSGNIADEYKNRLFVINDGVQLKRFRNVSEINDSEANAYVSRPQKNLFSTRAEKSNHNPFITLTLNNPLNQGEHLRVINKTQGKIWEIYSTNSAEYSCDKYCTISEDPSHLTVHRIYFNVSGDIASQCREIELAFDAFANYEDIQFRSGLRGDNWVSLVLNDNADFNEDWVFQRITASTLNSFDDPSLGFNTAGKPEDITFFGRFTPDSSDFEIISIDSSYGPIDFELFGERQSIMLDFFNRESYNLYSLVSSDDVIDKFENITLYQDTDSWYRKILEFDISTNSYLYVKDPLSIRDRILILTNAEVEIVNNKINTYAIWPINISLMGINPVKDFDFTVYDSDTLDFISEYTYKREDDPSTFRLFVPRDTSLMVTTQGSFEITGNGQLITDTSIHTYPEQRVRFHTFNGPVCVSAGSDTVITYAQLDGSGDYKALKDGAAGSEEDIEQYFENDFTLKYGLTVPTVSKWVALGTDCRGNSLRLMLNSEILDASTNFIPDENNFTQEISYPQFKYLTPGDRAWESYVYYDINDVLYDGTEYLTVKEAMFKYPYVDYFSKLVYSNYEVENKKVRSSIVYYNQYKDALDVIILGVKMSISIEGFAKNILNTKNYDRYRFSFISTPSKNKSNKRPIELIVNENTRTILMIWYQGNDELNYTFRNSSTLPGKSLLGPLNDGFVRSNSQLFYSFVKTPYCINNAVIDKGIINLYGAETTYSNGTTNRYAQFNKRSTGFSSIWNSPGMNNQLLFTGTFAPDTSAPSYNTFAQYVDYVYNPNVNTFNDYVINYGYNYTNNVNWYTNNTTNLNTLKYLLSISRNKVMHYIIRGDKVLNSYQFGNFSPIRIETITPRTYRDLTVFNGWFKPKFNTILNFKSDEDDTLINATERDFIFSNTNLRTHSNIAQLWYNKVVDQVTQTDTQEGRAISYRKDFNVFTSLWDADYFYKDDDFVNGYESPLELPSMFGSKLPKLPDTITLDKWTNATMSYSETATDITVDYNLTLAVTNIFKNNLTFVHNWSGLPSTDNIINGYIKKTIVAYYNLRPSAIDNKFYQGSFDIQRVYYQNDLSKLMLNEKQNFNAQMIYENDEYIYRIIIPKTGNFSYFISIKLTEK